MEIKDWFEMGTYLVAIIGGIVGAFLFLKRARSDSLLRTCEILQKAWTNEGDVTSNNTHFITFELFDIDGDLVGSLETNRYKKVLEVHATVGWFSTILHVSELVRRGSVSTAKIKVSVKGNNNRLAWKVVSGNKAGVLPQKIILWPSPVGVSR